MGPNLCSHKSNTAQFSRGGTRGKSGHTTPHSIFLPQVVDNVLHGMAISPKVLCSEMPQNGKAAYILVSVVRIVGLFSEFFPIYSHFITVVVYFPVVSGGGFSPPNPTTG